MNIEKEITVLGGLPLKARGRLVPPEPDVGFKGGVEDVTLHWPDGKEVSDHIYERMTDADWDSLHEELDEEISI